MRRGYSGFYKGNFLKSSYEYAYAKYLDYKEIYWKYEDVTYEIKGRRYTPDFFIYDSDGNITKVVEIRGGRDIASIIEAKSKLEELKSVEGINYELLLQKDLTILYQSEPNLPSFTAITGEWINLPETELCAGYDAELNPNYGYSHSEETKRIIGDKSKIRWEDDNYRDEMMIKLKESSYKISDKLRGKLRVSRETRECIICGKEFSVTPKTPKRYCSKQCSVQMVQEHAWEANKRYKKDNREKIKTHIESWAINNREAVQKAQYNKITPLLKDVVSEVSELYNVKDFRMISYAFFGEDKGRKELLRHLKNITK